MRKQLAETCKLDLPFPALYIQGSSIQRTTTTSPSVVALEVAPASEAQVFSENDWAARCAALSDAAHRGCGQVYETYELRVGASIDLALQQVPELQLDRAIEIAIQHDTPRRNNAPRQNGCCRMTDAAATAWTRIGVQLDVET